MSDFGDVYTHLSEMMIWTMHESSLRLLPGMVEARFWASRGGTDGQFTSMFDTSKLSIPMSNIFFYTAQHWRTAGGFKWPVHWELPLNKVNPIKHTTMANDQRPFWSPCPAQTVTARQNWHTLTTSKVCFIISCGICCNWQLADSDESRWVAWVLSTEV